jgi:hypothetical protein
MLMTDDAMTSSTNSSTSLEEIHKPSTLYNAGTRLTIERHEPPPPFGRPYDNLPVTDQESFNEKNQLEWCLEHPPRPGFSGPSTTRTLEIAKAIRTGLECGSQVVFKSDGLVAKIFDPMLYSFEQEESHIYGDPTPWIKIDVSTRADSDYSVEAAAYLELQNTGFPGRQIPSYHE